MDSEKINLEHDGKVTIYTGKSRKERRWSRVVIKLSTLFTWLKKTVVTSETVEEYNGFSKDKQDDIKDVGGFVGGTLKNNKRRRENLVSRSILTLDVDFASGELWESIELLFDFCCCIYSTHKHTRESPRYRLVIPLSREVSPEEYEALGRRVACDIGIDFFDDTTYEPSRLMYWPSTSCDGIFEFNYQDGGWLDVDEVLGRYEDWRDVSAWPESSRSGGIRERVADKLGNPREKVGVIGGFCRSYSIYDAIECFLSDVYKKTCDENRYSYVNGSTSGGLIVYENGDFAYSHHNSDPICGRLCNSFDLVRLHRFEGKDSESYRKMLDFAMKDERVRERLESERVEGARVDFQGEIPEGKMVVGEVIEGKKLKGKAWLIALERDKAGRIKATIGNILSILENDLNLKGKIALNEFSHRTMIRGNVPWKAIKNTVDGDPWKDSDDAALRHYIEGAYGIVSPNKIFDAFSIVEEKNKYHPIREYLSSLVWDGVLRVDSLLIDYLGAEDCDYTRKVTRKSIVAGVARVFAPGIKFDNMLVMVGKQGVGKSHIVSLLGQGWYSDSLNTVQGKEAYEQLQDAWLIEMAELSATKKAEAEAVKHFVSKREDIYRMAYGRRVTRFPRQCVFFGTTNDNEFLRDKTGNRRFWPVVVGVKDRKLNLWEDMDKGQIDQIWAEGVHYFKSGEKLFLNRDEEREAFKVQGLHTEESAKEGMVREYLEIRLPENWGELDVAARRRFVHGSEFGDAIGGNVVRDKVCAMEIWVELFMGDPKLMTPMYSREINDILRRIEGWTSYGAGSGKLRFGKIYGQQRAFVRESGFCEDGW